jgi:hypothetical protein
MQSDRSRKSASSRRRSPGALGLRLREPPGAFSLKPERRCGARTCGYTTCSGRRALYKDGAVPSQWRYPVWPEEIELQSDLSPSAWILPRLLSSFLTDGEGMPVGAIVPSGYPAYVRVLHPANTGGSARGVTWRDVATLSGRTYHPLMQYYQIREPDPEALGPPPFTDPSTGDLTPEQCDALYSTLATWTTTPETCWLGIWEGHGSLHAPSGGYVAVARSTPTRRRRRRSEPEEDDPELARMIASWEEAAMAVERAPVFAHPARTYLLARSSCSAVCELGRRPLGITPNLAWPDDRQWCVGSEIDFDSTLVACSRDCATALLADRRLEAVPGHAVDRLDSEGDLLNPEVDR